MALNTGQLDQAAAALKVESSNPDLRWLALVDPQGQVALATPPAWKDQMAHRTIEGLTDLGLARDASDSDWIHVDVRGDTLTAARPVAFPAEPMRKSATPGDQATRVSAAVADPRPAAVLYLALDLRRLRAAAWAQRLAPTGWLPWAIGTGISILLMAYLTEWRLGRPLRQIRALARPSGVRDEAVIRPVHGRGELADLSATLDGLSRRIRELETGRQAQSLRLSFALEGAPDGIWDWDPTTNRTFFLSPMQDLTGHWTG